VPAAAVIPAPIAYIKVVAVKKLVVGFRGRRSGPPKGRYWTPALFLEGPICSSLSGRGVRDVYFEKIRVFKAGRRLNTLAWNNGIGLRFYFVGFWDRSND
jgi:hypothetical protein